MSVEAWLVVCILGIILGGILTVILVQELKERAKQREYRLTCLEDRMDRYANTARDRHWDTQRQISAICEHLNIMLTPGPAQPSYTVTSTDFTVKDKERP